MRLIVFDFDGTLADTFPGIVQALNGARARFGLSEKEPEAIRGLIGYGLRHFMAGSLPSESRDDETVERFTETYKEIYREVAMGQPRLFDGVSDVLDTLEGEHLAVASNKSIEQLEPMLMRLKLYERLVCVVGGNSLTVRKPDRGVFDHIVAQVGPGFSEAWMIGDSEPDIELGLNSGAQTVGCLWGLRERAELERAGAHHLVDTPESLSEILSA
ncbi:MAG: HAD family hydrolase [Myxococcota bacterium]